MIEQILTSCSGPVECTLLTLCYVALVAWFSLTAVVIFDRWKKRD